MLFFQSKPIQKKIKKQTDDTWQMLKGIWTRKRPVGRVAKREGRKGQTMTTSEKIYTGFKIRLL
jgi:hypothetical protein